MTENRKYIFTDETMETYGLKLNRIVALRDIEIRSGEVTKKIKKGDKGGFIQCDDNLSHKGNCWVDGEALVFGGARVEGNAYVGESAIVREYAYIGENAYVGGENTIVDNYGKVWGNAIVHEGFVGNGAIVKGYSIIRDGAIIECGEGEDEAVVEGKAIIGKEGFIKKSSDYITFEMRHYRKEVRYTAYRTGYNDVVIISSENYAIRTIQEFTERITSNLEKEHREELIKMVKVIERYFGLKVTKR